MRCVLAVAVCVLCVPCAVLSAPLTSSKAADNAQQALLGTGSKLGVSELEALTTLRDALPALEQTLADRRALLDNIRSAQLHPLHERYDDTNSTVTTLRADISTAQARIAELPAIIQTTIATQEQRVREHSALRESLDTTMGDGERELGRIQERVQQARMDSAVLVELVKWIDTAAQSWNGEESFAQLRTAISRLHSNGQASEQVLLQAKNAPDNRLSTPQGMKELVESLRQETLERIDDLQRAYSNLTISLGNERTHFENKIAANEKSQETIKMELKQYNNELTTLQESLVGDQAKLSQAVALLESLDAQLAQASKDWDLEEEQIANLQMQITDIKTALRDLSVLS